VTPRRAARSTLLRYWAFQLPGTLAVALLLYFLVHSFDLSPRLAVAFLVLWFLKDLVLYPVVRKAYEARSGGGADGLLGRVGVARERLAPDGYVRLGPELWRARANGGPIEAGAAVRVKEVHGLTLVVEAAEAEERA
jgi:membrane-bound ClpP family serine protease